LTDSLDGVIVFILFCFTVWKIYKQNVSFSPANKSWCKHTALRRSLAHLEANQCPLHDLAEVVLPLVLTLGHSSAYASWVLLLVSANSVNVLK
jgi:hypothetical protein